MCGIAGFLDLKRRFGNQDAAELARTMADRITHRGPDAGGTWADATAGIAFGHRRLSIHFKGMDVHRADGVWIFLSRELSYCRGGSDGIGS